MQEVVNINNRNICAIIVCQMVDCWLAVLCMCFWFLVWKNCLCEQLMLTMVHSHIYRGWKMGRTGGRVQYRGCPNEWREWRHNVIWRYECVVCGEAGRGVGSLYEMRWAWENMWWMAAAAAAAIITVQAAFTKRLWMTGGRKEGAPSN